MTALAAAQHAMHDALVDPAAVSAGTLGLLGTGRLAAAEGLAIYQRGYFLRIAACMRGQFPALCHALGEPLFDDFTADYIRALPPAHHSLYDLGRRFPGWLADNRPDRDLPEPEREGWIDFMIDLAGFERAIFAMFDAPGHEGKPFATHDAPDAELRLQPCFALGAYRFDVAGYYHAVRRGESPPLPATEPSHFALVRTDYVTRTVPLSATHHGFLEAMLSGADVDGAIAAVAERLGADPEQVRASWRAANGSRARWIEWGFFVRRDG
jgi:hypothetical protein